MSEWEWVLFLGVVLLYAAFAARLGRLSVTMPMVFVLAGAILGPDALDLIDIPVSAEVTKHVTELTLGLLLFADASTLNLREVRQDAGLPRRLLLIGMPLTVLCGALAAYLLLDEKEWGLALLIGTILAPTDAALGMPIFTNPKVPARIRRALNLESGLNDGIATPLVTLFIAMTIDELGGTQDNWLAEALADIALAVLVGVVVGYAGGKLFSYAAAHQWTTEFAQRIGNLALALGVYWAALAIGGNGFIAAFVGGFVFGAVTRHALHEATDFTEEFGSVLAVFVWTIFGISMVVPLIRSFEPRAFVYALLSLTVIRMLPVAISMVGTGLRRDTVLVMGWLGPRGLASVVFTLIAFESFHEAGFAPDMLIAMAGWTIALSVILHAVTAAPLATWYARRLQTAGPDAQELLPSPELSAHHTSGHHRTFGMHVIHHG